jgi:ATP-binding cassette subfamily B protein
VLLDLGLDIPAGSIVGLLGRTGSGKSTLVKLLPRLLDPPPGAVFVDGHDVREYDLASLRSAIRVVPQDTFLFSTSIRENIAFGAEDADADLLERAAAISTIRRDLGNFPQGWETVVGERGITLSGGQKQRVALSRAIAAQAAIYILDDAMSSVDTETEEAILSALLPRLRGSTVILVSHRVSTCATRTASWCWKANHPGGHACQHSAAPGSTRHPAPAAAGRKPRGAGEQLFRMTILKSYDSP